MKIISRMFVAIVLGAILFSPVMAMALPPAQKAACEGSGGTDGGATCNVPGSPSITNIAISAISIFSIVIGLVAVVMFMVGGLKYITSQGDANQIASAKNTLLYAAVGIVVAALAQALVKFVLNKVK